MPVPASASSARAARTQAATTTTASTASNTTSGRTDIVNKYYPLKLRVWTDFPQLHRDTFARIQASLADQALFPSALAVRQLKDAVLDELPQEFLQSEAFLNEVKTADFIDRLLQKPVQKVMNAYLTVNHMEKTIFFNHRPTWARQASNASVENGENATAEARPPPPRKTQPDCVVLGTNTDATAVQVSKIQNEDEGEEMDQDEEVQNEDEGEKMDQDEREARHISRVTLGEHKAAHKLRAATVSGILRKPPAEDYMITLARRKTKLPSSTSAASGSDTSDTPGAKGHVFFVYALSQAFHYLILSDMEFGYIASGETLTFLRIPRDDRTCLLYYSSVFPDYASGSDNRAIEQAALPTAQLSSLCLLAIESDPDRTRRASRISSDLALLAQFPELPASVLLADQDAFSSQPSSRSSSKRRRDDDSDEEGGGGGGGGDEGDEGIRGCLRSRLHQPRAPSPIRRQVSRSSQRTTAADRAATATNPRRRAPLTPEPPHPFDPSSFRPILPYCTQACLRSLARDEELDYGCPNVLLHVRAAAAAGPAQPPRKHALLKQDVAELVQSQLLHNPDLDCECFNDRGLRGAVGCLFKITLTGYGYTFVAKGVAAHNGHKLRREMRVYDMLAPQQGTLIPVCLGIAALRLPYPLGNFQVVTHMLLMSYAGAPLHTRKVQKLAHARGIDLDEEAARTVRALAALGFVDEDEESTVNFAWCDEIGRVMKIDFDQAKVHDAPAKGVNDTPPTKAEKAEETMQLLLSPGRRKRVAGWDLEGAEGPRTRQRLSVNIDGLLLM